MPEARDRLSRQEDVIASYSRRRILSTGDGNLGRGDSTVFVLDDHNDEGQTAGTPFRWRRTAMVGTPGPMGVAAGRGATVTPRTGRTTPVIGRENLSPLVRSTRGRGRGNALPTWYPRRPLNDITAVVRALERRRERRSGEGLQNDGPILQDRILHSPSVSTSGHARLEHDDISMISPNPTSSKRRCCPPTIGKVPKILLDITNHDNGEDSACLTPQKKLLNNIDTVEKVVMEELRKLKRTPSAKKAEREKRVRTLMSMR